MKKINSKIIEKLILDENKDIDLDNSDLSEELVLKLIENQNNSENIDINSTEKIGELSAITNKSVKIKNSKILTRALIVLNIILSFTATLNLDFIGFLHKDNGKSLELQIDTTIINKNTDKDTSQIICD